MSDDETPTPRPELTFGRPGSSRLPTPPRAKQPGSTRDSGRSAVDSELRGLEHRCVLKSRAASLAADRERGGKGDHSSRATLTPWEESLVEEAEAAGCDLTPWGPQGTIRAIPEAWETLARCFQTLARAIDLTRRVATRAGPACKILTIEQALQTMAEAQSALRVAVQRISSQDDADQLAAYHWIEEQAAKRRIFLKRFMRKQDLANPDALETLIHRLSEWERSQSEGVQRETDLAALAEVASRVATGDRTAWSDLERQVARLLVDGVPASDSRLRTILTPILGERLDEMGASQALGAVARSWEEFLDSRDLDATEEHEESAADRAEIQTVASWLRGQTLVLIGGDRRPHAAESLERAFGLSRLEWVSTREHESVASFEAPIARPEVAVVLLAIRWASHAFGDVQRFCESHGKILVRLPGGYNPNQVAAQVVEQAGERLRAAAERQTDRR